MTIPATKAQNDDTTMDDLNEEERIAVSVPAEAEERTAFIVVEHFGCRWKNVSTKTVSPHLTNGTTDRQVGMVNLSLLHETGILDHFNTSPFLFFSLLL